MKNIGKKISEIRKSKLLTQDELADLSNVNLRTIQRIEKSENIPRGKTLSLICSALEIDINEFENKKKMNSIGSSIINGIFLLILNLLLTLFYGYLTLDSNANMNSRLGAFLLSFLIPFFIVWQTQKMTKVERMLKYGSGFIVYFILVLIISERGFAIGIRTGLFMCLAIALATLFYGKLLFNKQ